MLWPTQCLRATGDRLRPGVLTLRQAQEEPFTAVIDQILLDDLRRPRKQRHTAQRIFQRLRDEHGFGGQYTIVKDYVREHRRRSQEMFVPLSHPPGHAQCDFGEARVIIGGVEQKAHCFVLDLPHSDGCFVKAYPAETTEAFLDGHVSAFAFLGGVAQSILYDNTKLAVARILGDGRRKRTRAFTELQSHYLFSDRFGRPGKGNDKGKVEGMVGYMRRNFLVPVPSFESFDALNAHLERRCLARMDARLRGHSESIGQRMERDLEALLPLPPVAYDACEKQAGRVSSLSLVRYRTNDYSAPVAYGHRDVLVKGYVDRVVISCGSEVIPRHHRSYQRDDFVFDPVHYLPLLEQKTAALDQAAPLQGWELPEEFGTLRRLLESRMGRRGKREFVQVLRLFEHFSPGEFLREAPLVNGEWIDGYIVELAEWGAILVEKGLLLEESGDYHPMAWKRIINQEHGSEACGRPSPPRRGRERDTRPQVRRRSQPHAVRPLRRQRRLAGGTGDGPQPGPLDGADRPGRADSDHQDPQTTGLRPGRTHHPLGTPPHPASAPALALGNPVQSRPGTAASHSTPSLTASLQLTQRPLKLASSRSARVPCCVFSRHHAHPQLSQAAIGALCGG